MKRKSLVSLLSTVALSSVAFAASKESAQFEIYPKNLARQHLGANLFHYTAGNQTYTPTEAAAAWLDDDITTGWPMLSGKQYYLLSLPEAELLTNFAISARPASGTITLYAGNEPAPPGAKTWSVLARDVPFESINEKKLAHPFSRDAKYLLIETNVADPGPVYSLYVYGQKPAVDFDVQKRNEAIDTKAIFGPYVNDQTSISVTSLYAQSYVSHADGAGSSVSWQKAIDDNPESAVTLPPSTDKTGLTVQLDKPQSVTRIALLADPNAKGKLDFFLTKQDDAATTPPAVEAAITPPPGAEPAATPSAPTISIVLDGSNPRTSVDFPATDANQMTVRWTPTNGTDSVSIRELNAFGTPSLTEYAANLKPDAVGALGARDGSKDSSKDGKSVAENKGVKPPGIGEGPQGGPFLPGSLGFPPNVLIGNPKPPPLSP